MNFNLLNERRKNLLSLKHNLNKSHQNICAFDLASKHWHLNFTNENVCCLIYVCLISIAIYLLVPNISSLTYLVWNWIWSCNQKMYLVHCVWLVPLLLVKTWVHKLLGIKTKLHSIYSCFAMCFWTWILVVCRWVFLKHKRCI
jgi:hypothetical protein